MCFEGVCLPCHLAGDNAVMCVRLFSNKKKHTILIKCKKVLVCKVRAVNWDTGLDLLTHSHNNDTFWRVWESSLLKTLWQLEKLLVLAISPLPTMFSALSKTEITILVTFSLSSANAFNLVWSKILSCGNGLTGTVVASKYVFNVISIETLQIANSTICHAIHGSYLEHRSGNVPFK